VILRTVYDDSRGHALLPDSSAPPQHERAWARDDRSWKRSRIVDHRCCVGIGNVRMEPGGLISGGMDGILVVPRAIEEVASRPGVRKGERRKVVRKMIVAGSSSTTAFHKHGIL
jgi:regulator of RNase E activity RraA